MTDATADGGPSEVKRPAAPAVIGQGWAPAGNPWLIAVVVTLAAFMEILDTTIVNVALPHIAGSMSVSNDEATWTLTAYLVDPSWRSIPALLLLVAVLYFRPQGLLGRR